MSTPSTWRMSDSFASSPHRDDASGSTVTGLVSGRRRGAAQSRMLSTMSVRRSAPVSPKGPSIRLRALFVGGGVDRDHEELSGVDRLRDTSDRAALAGGVHSFEAATLACFFIFGNRLIWPSFDWHLTIMVSYFSFESRASNGRFLRIPAVSTVLSIDADDACETLAPFFAPLALALLFATAFAVARRARITARTARPAAVARVGAGDDEAKRKS